ncbi:MAG: MFS transporter, partial [Anaerolineaceae bacterium]
CATYSTAPWPPCRWPTPPRVRMRLTSRGLLLGLGGILALRLLAMAMMPFADTSEPRYAEIARLMATTGDWITPWFEPGEPFWGKPPLAFWAQALSIRLFGLSELAVRLPSWLAMLGVLALGFVANEAMWRWGFVGLGAFSVLSGLLIWWLVEELPAGSAEPEIAGLVSDANAPEYKINWKDVFSVLRIPTIWVAIAQGVTGTMPWVVMGSYLINWMVNYLGFSNGIVFDHPRGSAPLTFAAIIIGSAIGNYLGGVIGDYADKLNGKYGRTIIGQFSVIVGIPLTYILFTQGQHMSSVQMLLFAFFIALMITWPGRGAKEPMMQAVVLPEIRSSAYSVVNLIEGGLSAFSGLIAGALADKIGLTKAMLWTVPFPWVLCAAVFTLFYFTYPKDSARVHQILQTRREQLLKKAADAQWDADKIKSRIGLEDGE